MGRWSGVVVFLLLAGCSSASRTADAPPSGGCAVATQGPLVGWAYRLEPRPAAAGGAITDGDYDLVGMVQHGSASGPTTNAENPALRMAIHVATTERSSNHAQGRMTVKLDLPPASKCTENAFATTQAELRGMDERSPLSARPYSANAGELTLYVGEKAVWVFRRRG